MCLCIVVGSIMFVALIFIALQFYTIPFFSYFNSPLVYTSFFGWTLFSLFKYGKEYLEYLQLQSITRTKQIERKAEFEKLRKLYELTPYRQAIVNLSTEELIEKLQKKLISASDCLSAFIAKSLQVTDECNCITEFIPNAMSRAQRLDEGEFIKGPLHGLPVCIKDDTNVRGMDSTLGYAKNLYSPAPTSATLVQTLISLGAVPFCKTNVPQTLVSFASDNPIFGKTLNSINPKLAPGGSSSGTGSLVAAGGAPFGTGTDIGGSGRIPAHFNGISSLKPSSNRLSGLGIRQATPNCVGLVGVPSIFAKTPHIVSTIFQHLTEEMLQNKCDPLALPLDWNKEIFESKKNLRIGYFTTLKFFPTIGDTGETVMNAKEALENIGHTLVPFELPVNENELAKLMADIANSDTGKYLRKALRGEKISDAASMLNNLIHMPFWLRKILSVVIKWKYLPFYRSARAAYCILAGLDLRLTTELWDAMGEKNKIIRSILDEMDKNNLDLILSPVFPFCAPDVDASKDLVVAVIYCMIWNLCDFPAGVVPFGTESGTKIKNFDDEGDMFLKIAKKSLKGSKGMPIGVQIVGRPYKEEMVLRAMNELYKAKK